jgi:hypothetical protein
MLPCFSFYYFCIAPFDVQNDGRASSKPHAPFLLGAALENFETKELNVVGMVCWTKSCQKRKLKKITATLP